LLRSIAVEDFLERLVVGEKNKMGSLRHLAYIAGYSELKYAAKPQLISVLHGYYNTPGRFQEIWKSLKEYECAIIAIHVWSGGQAPGVYAEELAENAGLAAAVDVRVRAYYIADTAFTRFRRYIQTDSMFWLLFSDEYGRSSPYADELVNAVGAMPRNYSSVPEDGVFVSRENRTGDFAAMVKWCNTNKASVTANGLLSKSPAIKIWKQCGYAEISYDSGTPVENVRTLQKLCVTFPLYVLSVIGGLLVVTENIACPGAKAPRLLNQQDNELIRRLYESYLSSQKWDEISVMQGIKAKRGHKPNEARVNLAEELKLCPVGRAASVEQFEKYLRFSNADWARKDSRYVVNAGGGNYYSYDAEWDNYEKPLLRLILTFFGALGMLDICYGCGESGVVAPVYFKITPLGAWVLGLTPEYNPTVKREQKIKGGFTVLPDYSVIVPESMSRLEHEMFFERLLTKVSATEQSTIYRLDFESCARAIDMDIGIDRLQSYLSASEKPLPDNVVRALDDWRQQSRRINLRRVTVIECDDALLLEELLHYRGMGAYIKDKLVAAAVIDDDSVGKVKKLIEKNKRFCKYDSPI
jgi:hypothetical protein